MSVSANLRDAGEDLNPDSFVKRSLMAQINSVNEVRWFFKESFEVRIT